MLNGRVAIPAPQPVTATPGSFTPPQPPPQMFTDGQGRFVFRDLARGPYGLAARASGYLTGNYGQRQVNGPSGVLTLDDNARKTEVTIRLWRQASIAGAVRDEAGDPVVNVPVGLLRSTVSLGRQQWFQAQSATTDDRGMFRISGLAPGNYYVFLANTTSSVPMTTIDEYMRPTSGQAAQTARNELMRELSMAGVQIGGAGLQVGTQQLLQQGQYGRHLMGPPPVAGTRMMVYPTTFYPSANTPSQAMNITLATGEERAGVDLQLKLLPAFSVSGTVLGPDGPMANMPLRLQAGGLDEMVIEGRLDTAATVSDAFGQFTFLGVPTGQYTLHALRVPRVMPPPPPPPPPPPGAGAALGGVQVAPRPVVPQTPTDPTLWARVVVSVGDEDVHSVPVQLSVGARLRGRVDFQGAASRPTAERLQQLTVNLSVADSRSFNAGFAPARVAADGTFTTMSYPPGKYYLSVGSPGPPWWVRSIVVGGRESLDTPIDLQSDLSNAIVTFTDQTNEITGTVQQASPDEAPPRVVVIPVDYQRSLDEGVLPRRMRQTNAGDTGQFAFRNLLPGDYLIAAVSADVGNLGENVQTLSAVARAGTRVTVTDGGKQSISLTVKVIR